MKDRFFIIIFIISCGFPQIASSQNIQFSADTIQPEKKILYKALAYTSAYYAGSMFVLGKTWYNDRKRVPFHFYNDNSGYLQVDKFGHAFGAYVYSYLGFHYLQNSGYSRKEALVFGATLGLVMQTPIEIMDGIYEGYGFSWGDIVANASGSALVLGQELLFREQVVKYKFSYWESSYSKKANGFLGTTTLNRVLKDYNGQTYWLSAPVNKLGFSKKLPDWLCISAGYGANGMYGEFENISSYNGVEIPETKRYRQFLFSFDVDWTKIKTNSPLLKTVFKGMTFIKVPFPVLEYNSMGKFRGYWLYW
jgi:uncharacterized protein YfiM (DUF2279 family)